MKLQENNWFGCEMCENGEPCIHCLGAERARLAKENQGLRAALDELMSGLVSTYRQQKAS